MDIGKFSEFCVLLSWIYSVNPPPVQENWRERAFCTCCDPTWLGRCMNAALAWDLILIGKHCHLDSCRKDAGQKEPGQWCLLPALITYCHLRKYYIYYIYAIKQEFWHIILYSSWAKAKTTICVWCRNVARQEGFKWRRFLRWLITSWKWRRTLKRRCRSHRCNPNVSCPYAETFLHQIICGHL